MMCTTEWRKAEEKKKTVEERKRSSQEKKRLPKGFKKTTVRILSYRYVFIVWLKVGESEEEPGKEDFS